MKKIKKEGKGIRIGALVKARYGRLGKNGSLGFLKEKRDEDQDVRISPQ